MRLSQIKLSGFKSFPDNINISVQGNIVAVVGPNGCGKSNLIDAVRWVLGESSAKHLRGENMQDVLFNGTNNRKMVSRSSVELVFDNSKYSLKGAWGQYTEISVKRILTRQGDSSYWINNHKVRKKDITDLFLGTGLGARGYAVIEQGMISEIIEAKPESLRAYIDEVAGISKYKEQRKETENRLKLTQENLGRISDLKQELWNQCQKLGTQAKKAQKYQRIESELKYIQNMLVASQLRITLGKLEGYQQKQNQEKEKLLKIEQSIKSIKEDNYQIQLQEYDIQSKIDDIHQKISKINEEVIGLQTALKFKEKELFRIQTEKKNIHLELQELNKTIQDNESSLSQFNILLEEKELIFENLVSELSQLYTHLSKIEQHFEQQEILYNGVKSEIRHNKHTLQARNESLQRNFLEIQKLTEQLQRQEQKTQEKVLLDLTEYETKLKILLESLTEKTEHIDRLDKEYLNLQVSIKENNEQIHKHNDELIALDVELNILNQRLQRIKEKHNGFWNQFPELPSSPLCELLTIRDKWEKALSIYLGERLLARVCVIIPFIPTEIKNPAVWINQLPPEMSTSVTEDSIIQYVACNDEIMPLIKLWLGKVRCVNSLEEGLRKQSLLREGELFLTPDGIVVDKYAVYLEGENQEDLVLNLQNHLSVLNPKKEKLVQVITRYKQQLFELKKKQESLLAEKNQVQYQKEYIQDQLTKTKQVIVESKAKNELQQQFLKDVQAEIHNLKKQKELLQARQKELESEVSHVESILNQDNIRIIQIEKDYLYLKKSIKDGQQDLLICEKNKNQLELELTNLKNCIGNVSKNLNSARQKTIALTQKNEQLQVEDTLSIDDYQKRIIQLSDNKQRIDVILASLEEELQMLRTQKNAMQSSLAQKEIMKSVMERDIHAYELKIQQQTIYKNQYMETLQAKKLNVSELVALDDQNDYNVQELSDKVSLLTEQLKALGTVNLRAVGELTELEERYHLYRDQYEDVASSVTLLQEAIKKIDAETEVLFKETLEKVNAYMSDFFPKLLGGGEARLDLTSDNLLDTGLRLMVRPIGKKNLTIHLLSGGEKALTALSLVFSLFSLNPAPFCLLDEVDAPLDDVNIQKFSALVKEMSKTVQFLFISHNPLTMEMAEQLIGVTMQEKGVSRIVSVNMNDGFSIKQ
ncbi:MAG: chromosome segregation protein SMC [Neisseriaceae bacterium]|nr:MAG: chromosome segregation protein SMC [Neisseriaceae bacterium]